MKCTKCNSYDIYTTTITTYEDKDRGTIAVVMKSCNECNYATKQKRIKGEQDE